MHLLYGARASALLFVVSMLFVATPALAQEEPRAITKRATPIFLKPDATLVPLVTMPEGRELDIIDGDDLWLRVQFQDQLFGRRTGYVATADITVLRRAEPPTPPAKAASPPPVIEAPPVPRMQPQAQAEPPPARRAPRSSVLGIGGLTFQSETSNLFGVEIGGVIGKGFETYGHVGRMTNILPKSVQEDLDDIARTLEILTGADWEFDGKMSGVYWGGGVKYVAPINSPVRPYVLGGFSSLWVKVSVTEKDLGDILEDLVEDGLFDEDDFKGMTYGWEAGGGVSIAPNLRLLLDVGYRYMRVGQINVSRVVGGVGVRF